MRRIVNPSDSLDHQFGTFHMNVMIAANSDDSERDKGLSACKPTGFLYRLSPARFPRDLARSNSVFQHFLKFDPALLE